MRRTAGFECTRAGAGRQLAALAAEALDRGVPRRIAEEAAEAALGWWQASAEQPSRGRLRAYYWGVVRKRAFRRGDGCVGLRQRFVIASVVEDLRRAGADDARIRDEVLRCYGVTLDQLRTDAA